MTYNGAAIIIHLLEKKGINVVAGIPGSANLPLYEALGRSRIRHVLARHEQGAGFIAQGWARSRGEAAVCFATSGPGATNLLTAIADAKLDSVPLVAITGQVPTAQIGTDAFQEIDTYGLTIPITKHNFLVRSARELLDVVPMAFFLAESGRPGPVVIDVPKDVQLQEIEVGRWPAFSKPDRRRTPDEAVVAEVAALLNKAERPLLLVGAGVVESTAAAQIGRLVDKAQVPLACTLRGLGILAPSHPLNLGMIGMHGTPYANRLMEEADLVLALGVRFDDRATGQVTSFCRSATLVHVDIDKAEINKVKPSQYSVQADIHRFLSAFLPLVTAAFLPLEAAAERKAWCGRVAALKAGVVYPVGGDDGVGHVNAPFGRVDDGFGRLDDGCFEPISLIRRIAAMVPANTLVSTDVGQHQMWVAQAYPFQAVRQFLTSGGLGTMGFGLPVAIGAALAHPDRLVLCFSGDGSLLMNIQELATLAETKARVVVLLFNNGHLGLVRQQQSLFYGKQYTASAFEVRPDFCGLATAFGIKAVDLSVSMDPVADLTAVFGFDGPVLVNIPIEADALVLPMVPPGGSNQTMIDKG